MDLPIPNWASIPAASIAKSPRSLDWCDRLWRTANYNFSGKTLDTVSCDFGMNPISYCQPVYYVTNPKTDYHHIAPRNHGFNGYLPPAMVGTLVPIPAGAIPSTGRDGQMTVVDLDGSVWNYWGLSVPWNNYGIFDHNWAASANNPWGERPQLHGVGTPGFDINSWAVTATIEHFPVGDQSNTNVHNPAAGMHVGILRPQDVLAGIKHALQIWVSGLCSMTGPLAPASITDPDDPKIGTTYGCSASPANQLESRGLSGDLTGMVPDGMRFCLNISDADIDTWLASRKYTGALKTTAKAIAVALRDYGFYTAATTGPKGPAIIPMDASASAQQVWKTLGITPANGGTILIGLITKERLVALRPPAATRTDGTISYREGLASSFSYN